MESNAILRIYFCGLATAVASKARTLIDLCGFAAGSSHDNRRRTLKIEVLSLNKRVESFEKFSHLRPSRGLQNKS